MKIKLAIMNFLQFAVWGAYLTSMGTFLSQNGFGDKIGTFYATQGIVSLFFPALLGMVADRFIQAQRLYIICHLLSAMSMLSAGYFGLGEINLPAMYTSFFFGIGFYMASLSLSYSVAYNALDKSGMDTVKDFPPIRVWGTVGFIATMWTVDLLKYQDSAMQFVISGLIGIVLALYANIIPKCEIKDTLEKKSFASMLGLDAFKLFKDKRMAMFFIFSMLLGVALQITNSYANPFIRSFENISEFADTFGVKHTNILISLSQVSETLCILLIPFCLKRFGIKRVMLIAMTAWVLRFLFFGLGNPGSGVWLFILSCIVYGVAFDFFNVSGSLFVDKETDKKIRSSAQGLFMLMTNGIGATIGTLIAQHIVNINVYSKTQAMDIWQGWQNSWFIFAGYALLITILFAIFFKYKHKE
ncbi:MAG: MFS transporter [Bacteroidales bacterium]|nr:MFS transporter [Bacteroidales bacterium]